MKRRVAVLGSGSGTNARSLVAWGTRKDSAFSVELIISTSTQAGINAVAQETAVTLVVLDQSSTPEQATKRLLDVLRDNKIEILVLAGYLRLLHETVIMAMDGNVLNIHPALLPLHGGPGMYGKRVHQAVLESGDLQTGPTVHLVNQRYDEGRVLGQSLVPIMPGDTVQTVEQRVKAAELLLYPKVLDFFASNLSVDVGKWSDL